MNIIPLYLQTFFIIQTRKCYTFLSFLMDALIIEKIFYIMVHVTKNLKGCEKVGKFHWFVVTLLAMLLAACGGNEESKNLEENADVEVDINEEKNEKVNGATTSFDEVNKLIQEATEGNIEVVYTNESANYSHDMKGFIVDVPAYQIVKVTDMNRDFLIQFDDQQEGYIIIAKTIINNTTEKDMYYNLNFNIRLTHETDYIPFDLTFLRKELFPRPQNEQTRAWAPGEIAEGYVTFTLTNEQFEAISSVKPKFVIEGGVSENESFKESILDDAVFDFVYSEEYAKEVGNTPQFYPDRLTTANWADKVMIFEKSNINETKQIDNVIITLDGVQYTEVIPTAGNEERFRNFGDSGVVAITVRLLIDNQSSEKVNIDQIGSKLRIDDNRGTAIASGMVEPSDEREVQPGEQGVKHHVFLFRKDEFEIFKRFDLEFGPFTNDEGKDQFKGKTVTFTLPR